MTFPEPMNGISGNGYRVRIAEVGGGLDKVRCSDDFYIVSTMDMSMQGGPGGPSMWVVSPTEESVAIAGGEYTVEVRLQLKDRRFLLVLFRCFAQGLDVMRIAR